MSTSSILSSMFSCPWLRICSTLLVCQISVNVCAVEFRTFDGTGNNLSEPTWGAAETRVIRFGYETDYPDAIGDVITENRKPNPRDVSNAVLAQPASILNRRGLSDWIVHWGQFLTHDMTLIRTGAEYNTLSTGEMGNFDIPITDADDPLGPGVIPFNRSEFDPTTGDGSTIFTPRGPQFVPRWQINAATSFIDASNVYGSSPDEANALRSLNGGRLRTTAGGLLPDTDGAGNFLAGDPRANENVGLTAIHTLFVREHNRLAGLLAEAAPELLDEQIYQWARRIVGAQMQAITYNEFLPALMGNQAPRAEDFVYTGIDASITTAFSTAAFRYGHSMQSPELLLVGADGSVANRLGLVEASRNPALFSGDPTIVGQLLKGLATQVAQENDAKVVDELRNLLLGPPGSGISLDLASLDIQRGRDHGLLNSFNLALVSYSLPTIQTFAELTSDPELQSALAGAYGEVDNIDLWVGILAEDHLPDSTLGQLGTAILQSQFERLRDGDRFFYTGDADLQDPLVTGIIDLEQLTLSELISLNTGMELQENVFFAVPEPAGRLIAILCAGWTLAPLREAMGLRKRH